VKSKKHKKRRPLPLRMILILLILIAAAVIILLLQRGFELGIPNPFVRTEKTAASDLVLKQVRDISRLNTIEFIYKSVFPHDLIDSSIDPANLMRRYKNHETLSLKELEMLALFGIAAEAGIDPGGTSFAVVTVRIKAGFDFPENLPEDSVKIDAENNAVEISLPPVNITEVIIEDADSSVYEYPDLDVSPEQWKTLTSILSKAAQAEAQRRGILAEAELRGKQIIERLLLSSGYGTVTFSN